MTRFHGGKPVNSEPTTTTPPVVVPATTESEQVASPVADSVVAPSDVSVNETEKDA
jgi:hypothetical protein